MINIKVPEGDRQVIEDILSAVSRAESALVTWHARPDGDAVGGGLALSEILAQFGVRTELVSPTPPPAAISFLKNFEKIRTSPSRKSYDLIFILDCSEVSRLEGLEDSVSKADIIINVDHHQKNRLFGDINYVRPEVSSVSELVINIAAAAGVNMGRDFALGIYVGIITDTNRFQEQNTTANTHLIAAELVREFISPVKVAALIYGSEELGKLRLTAKAIESLSISGSGRVGYIIITQEMLDDTGMKDENIEGIINYARNIRGVEAGIVFRKIPGLNGVKVSFRSKGSVDVGRVAGIYGGGGHRNASGCFIEGDFEEIVPDVVKAVEGELGKE